MTNGTKKGLHPLAWVGIGCGCLLLIGVGLFVSGVGFAVFKGKQMVDEFQENPEASTARLIALANPDLELVETNDEDGTVTFRNTKEDKEFTVDYDDIKDGKLTIQTEEGEMSFEAQGGEDGGSFTFQDASGETTTVDVQTQGDEAGTVTVQGPDGETRYGANLGMDDVPDWVPLYPGADQSQSNFSASGSEGQAGMLTLSTSDSTDDVMEHFKKVLEDAGYTVEHNTVTMGTGQEGGSVSGTKDGGYTVSVIVGRDSGSDQTSAVVQYNGPPA